MEQWKNKTFVKVGVILLLGMILCIGVVMYVEEIQMLKQTVWDKADNLRIVISDRIHHRDYRQAEPFSHKADAWYQSTSLIYHAAGGIDGHAYTNSKEALEQTLDRGNYVIEMDFQFTADDELICGHDWVDWEQIPTLEEFLSYKVIGKYTPLTARDVIAYMAEHEQFRLVIDAKAEEELRVIQTLVDLGAPEGVADRFVIQLYRKGQKQECMQLYPFEPENFLFTVYKFNLKRINEMLELCYSEDVRVMTMPYAYFEQDVVDLFREKNIVLFEHTVNRPDYAWKAFERGISGLYTDFLMEGDLMAQ